MNLIYTIAYGDICNHRVPLMVQSMRELGKFEGDIVVFSDQDKPIPGARVVFLPELIRHAPVMALRWLIGCQEDFTLYDRVAMIDTDVVAIRPINSLFEFDPGPIFVPKEYPDGRRTEGHTPWSIDGIPMDSSKPFHNCGTVFGSGRNWKAFSTLMWDEIQRYLPRIPAPHEWCDQQILNHIERHSLFDIRTIPDEWIFLCRRMMGASPQTKLVHCIPGGKEKVQLMHLAYSLACQGQLTTCRWIEDGIVYHTSCGESVSLNSNNYGFKFCPYCKGRLT